MKLPTVRDFYRQALERYDGRPMRQIRHGLLFEAKEKWDSMMEAYGEWEPRNVYQQDDPQDGGGM